MNLDKLYNGDIPIKATDHINDVVNKIHDQLFEEAINKYIIANNIDKDNYKIIDLKNSSHAYWPSQALFINRTGNKKLSLINLDNYWNTNYSWQKDSDDKVKNNLLIGEENKKNNEIINIDYINGTVKFKNKFTNKEFDVKFDKLNMSPDIKKNIIQNTFRYKYIYGNDY